jgi:hypothetical protein
MPGPLLLVAALALPGCWSAPVAEELTVSVRRDGHLASAGGPPPTVVTDAQVLSVDPSYRLVTLHFPGRAK